MGHLPITVPARHIPLEAIRDAAAAAVYGGAIRTPLIRLELPQTGGSTGSSLPTAVPDIYLKLEVLQPIGSFKIRGAYNVVRQLSADRLKEGIWTVSAGNATAGLEILEDLPDVDAIVAPLGGGGLLSGLAAAVRALRPHTRIYAAEPETAAPLSASLAAGRPVYFDNWRASFVDGAGGKSVLETMWPLLSAIAGSIVVPLDEVVRAMKLVAERTHVIAEGAAGCAIAAALGGRAGTGKVVAVVSGGNIDLSKFASLVGACDAAQSSIVNHQ